jgi:hypothetical protein
MPAWRRLCGCFFLPRRPAPRSCLAPVLDRDRGRPLGLDHHVELFVILVALFMWRLPALRAARWLAAIAPLSCFLATGAPTAQARLVEIHRSPIELAHGPISAWCAMTTGLT